MRYQYGQAMTETAIMASMILLPLFLLIPLLGKYIDIQHSTIQAARYEAWEYTVWFRTAAEEPSGTGITTLPRKSYAKLQAESRQRFFSDTAYSPDSTVSIISDNDDSQWDIDEINPLWKDHRDVSILSNTGSIETPTANSNATTPGGVATALLNIALDVFNFITTGFSTVMSWLGGSPPLFDAINTGGYSKAEVLVPITTPPGIIDFGTISDASAVDTRTAYSLIFRGKAAVLTDGWNAGGKEHVINQAGGLAITKLLGSMPGLGPLQWAVSAIWPELRPCTDPPFLLPAPLDDFDPDGDGSLWFGYLDTEAVPPDRLVVADTDDFIGDTSGSMKGVVCDSNTNICSFNYADPDYVYPYAINQAGHPDECN